MKKTLIMLVLLVLGATAPAGAQEFHEGQEFALGALGAGSTVVGTGDSFLVVYGAQNEIYGQRFLPGAVPLGDPFRINSYTTGFQSGPSIAGDASGNFVVVWNSRDQDGSGTGIFGQRLSPLGSPLGGEFQVNTYTTGNQLKSSIDMTDSGSFTVVWNVAAGAGVLEPSHRLRQFDGAGLPLGDELVLNGDPLHAGSRPGVAVDPAGGWLTSAESGGPEPIPGETVAVWSTLGSDTVARLLQGGGEPIGGEFQVSDPANGGFYPSVAMGPEGRFIVVWTTTDGLQSGVFARRFDRLGDPLGDQFQVNVYTTDRQHHPAISMDPRGNFVVAWESYGQDGSGEGLFGRRFDSLSVALGPEFLVPTYTTGEQVAARVSVGESGTFVVTWGSRGQNPPYLQAYGKQFLTACTPPLDPVPDLELRTENGGVDLLMTWSDLINAEEYIVLQSGEPDGLFDDVAGSAVTGVTGLQIPAPGATTYYLVAPRSAACGLGPRRL
jgi:hypothetical protein